MLIRAPRTAPRNEMVQRTAIVVSREHQYKQQQSESRNHVSVELIKRFFQEMAACDEDK
jgi:hypothetical protein